MPALENLRRANTVDPLLQNSDVLSVLCDIETLSGAFLSMYSRHASIEDGERILRSKAMPWLKALSQRLHNGTYTFPPLSALEPKSMNLPKYDPTLQSFPLWWEKTVPDAIRFILEAIFEPSFLRSSHGYRPNKGCYTALKEVKYSFSGIDYFLVGDLSVCMEDYDVSQLMKDIEARISDPVFLQLLKSCIQANYADLSIVSYKCVGLPQTTLLGPILNNIYLHTLDSWFEDLIKCIDVGGQSEGTDGSRNVLENRVRWGSTRLAQDLAWKSPTLKGML